VDPIILTIIYLLACVIVGIAGSRRSMGFFGAFFLSLFLTPIPAILILVLTRPAERYRRERDRPPSPVG
jgi:hypothetical protein